MIHIAGQSYPFSSAVIVAGRIGESTHAAGTWAAACSLCGVMLLVDLINHLLIERSGLRAVCLACASRSYPGMIVGEVEGRSITMSEAVERGWLTP
jgi:hypothetical protein